MMKVLLGILILVLGLAIGWYFLGGKIPTSARLPGMRTTGSSPSATPTQKPDYVFEEENISPAPSDGESTEKGGIQSQGATGQATVSYTDNGFSPSVLTVRVNTVVTFKNQVSAPMRVITAPHPAHNALSGLNQKSNAGQGGIYEYTFTQVGTWKYHNESAPEKTGIIVVTQ